MLLASYIGANVARLRRRLGLTQAQLAELVGVESRHLQRIERGSVDLPVSSLEALSVALGVKPQVLLRPATPEPAKVGRPSKTKSRRPAK